jgi:hypothetical protein
MAARRNASPPWVHFPYIATEYEFCTSDLRKRWIRLHAGDAEKWPDAKRVAAAFGSAAARALVVPDAAASAIAAGVQEAWIAFHRGDFRAAWQGAPRWGAPGIAVAVKAAAVYAGALETDAARAESLLQQAVELAARAAAGAPDYPNAHYVQAFALGRYSQRISVLKALAAGHAGTIRRCLDRTLELEPKHADAHVALGVYHAEIVAKVGGLAARVTYGATASAAEDHFERALALDAHAPVVPLEYGLALAQLHGRRAAARTRELLSTAVEATPADAMERLDVERARRELAALER